MRCGFGKVVGDERKVEFRELVIVVVDVGRAGRAGEMVVLVLVVRRVTDLCRYCRAAIWWRRPDDWREEGAAVGAVLDWRFWLGPAVVFQSRNAPKRAGFHP